MTPSVDKNFFEIFNREMREIKFSVAVDSLKRRNILGVKRKIKFKNFKVNLICGK